MFHVDSGWVAIYIYIYILKNLPFVKFFSQHPAVSNLLESAMSFQNLLLYTNYWLIVIVFIKKLF